MSYSRFLPTRALYRDYFGSPEQIKLLHAYSRIYPLLRVQRRELSRCLNPFFNSFLLSRTHCVFSYYTCHPLVYVILFFIYREIMKLAAC